MRVFLLLIALGVLASGCHHPKATKPAPIVNGPPPSAFAAVPGEGPAKPQPPPAAVPPTAPVTAPVEAKPVTPPPVAVAPEAKPVVTPGPKVTVTPDTSYVGKVATVNSAARFVVLSFPAGHMPPLDQKLNVSRKGNKIGEVRITGPQLDENVVADIITGEADAGDEVASR